MAKAHSGPGYICNFPAEVGGGTILCRYLTLEQRRRIRQKHSDDFPSMLEEMTMRSIADVSPDIAEGAGVVGGELSGRGLIPVDDNEPGRVAVFASIGAKRQDLLISGWSDRNTVGADEIVPFVRAIEEVCD